MELLALLMPKVQLVHGMPITFLVLNFNQPQSVVLIYICQLDFVVELSESIHLFCSVD